MPPTAPAAPPPLDGGVLRQRLAALRRRLRRTAVLRGVSWLAIATAGIVGAACLLDSFWPLPSLLRALALVAWLVAAGLLAWRYLFRPLSQRSDDLSLALRVEQRFPALNDALASTVQFLDAPAGAGGESAGLRREAVKRTIARVKGYDFNRVVDGRGLLRTAAAAVLTAAAAVALLLCFPKPGFSALARLLNPFNNRSLPPETELALDPEPPPDRVGKGEAYEIVGHVTGALPAGAKAKVIVRVDGYATREYATDVTPDGAASDGRPRAKLSFRIDKAERNFHFRVRYNDAEKGEYTVKVLPPPALATLDNAASPQVQLVYPAYTGLPSPHAQPPGQGEVDAVLGTTVTLRAAADRPLRAAWVDFPVLPHTAAAALGGAGAAASAPLARVRVPARLDDGSTSFTVPAFRPEQSGAYALHFEDDAGLGATRLFTLTVRDDPAPTVRLDRPSQTSDVLSVLPTASLPLEATAQDLLYGLRSVSLEYHLQADGSPRQRLILHDPATAAAGVLAPLTGPAVEAVAPPLRPTRLEFRRTLAVSSLRRPDGTTPQEGDVFLLRAVADDWDDVSPAKEPGHSDEVEIHVVGRNALDLAVAQDEGELQQNLARLREKELQALQHAEDAEGKLKQIEETQPKAGDQGDEAKKRRAEAEKLLNDVEDALMEAGRLQREIDKGVADRTGARAQARRLLEALKANGEPPNTPLRDRLERAEQELGRIADNELRRIDPKLAEAMKKVERRASLEAQARDEDRQAQEAEQAADRAEKDAAGKDGAEKDRLTKEAAQDRAKASDLRKAAEKLRADAAGEAPGPDVAKAEEMQTEVARTLNDLQSYSSTREAKVEAGRILEEQRKLEKEAEKLDDDVRGKDPRDLTDAQKAELDRLRGDQKRLEERTQQLLSQMQRTADAPKELEKLKQEQDAVRDDIDKARGQKELEKLAGEQKNLADRTRAAADEMKRLGGDRASAALKQAADAMDRDAERLKSGQRPDSDAARKALAAAQQEKDPAGARQLKAARDRATQAGPDKDEAGVQGDMKKAGEELAKNQLGDARKDQDRAANKLQEMLGQFRAGEEEQHEGDLDQLAKKLAEKQKELDKLAQDQDELRKKIKETKDPKELEQLAKQQKDLAARAKAAADELQRLGAERAGADARQAADAMNQDADKLEKGEKPENEDLALDRLQDAQDDADDARQDAQDQLEREKQARIAEEVEGLKNRQEALNQEAARLHDTLAKQEVRRDVLLGSVGGLRDAQNGLAGETEALAKKELADAPVLLRMTERASESMTDAGSRLDEGMKARPALIGDAALEAQKDASHRLALVLDALKSSDPALPPPGGGKAGGPAGPNGDPDTQLDAVPPVAQLKLLRALQQEVKDRTDAFEKANPDPAKYGEKEKAELENIHKEQQDVTDLMEGLRRPAPPKDGLEKK